MACLPETISEKRLGCYIWCCRLWLLLLHVLHIKRRLEGEKAEAALSGGAAAAEDAVLLLDEALQRGILLHADPLAALATT